MKQLQQAKPSSLPSWRLTIRGFVAVFYITEAQPSHQAKRLPTAIRSASEIPLSVSGVFYIRLPDVVITSLVSDLQDYKDHGFLETPTIQTEAIDSSFIHNRAEAVMITLMDRVGTFNDILKECEAYIDYFAL